MSSQLEIALIPSGAGERKCQCEVIGTFEADPIKEARYIVHSQLK